MRDNPKNVRFDDIDSLLIAFGFEKRQRGSHATYLIPGERPLTIPRRLPFILPIYVKEVLDRLEAMELLGEINEPTEE